MRFHTLVAAFVAAGAVAETKIEVARQKGQTDVNRLRILDQAPSTLAARSRLSFHALSTRRTSLETDYDAPFTTLSRREDDDDDEDEDRDNESDGDHDEDDRNDRHRPNTAAIAGGVVGGVVLLLLLLFLLFWFKFRPRRQNRRQKRRQRDEEEERQRKKEVEEEQENRHAVNIQGPYQPIPSDEPPHYQRVVAAAAASAPPASPPRGTADFPAELPSPVDGREPSPLPPPSHLDFSKETHWPRQPTQITIHPEERPGRAY
ncbi:hypothetical protein CIB48_g10556 [Xylaria polymorpha]|nr:hypothetical protein CIB48_g10556 [Xylaria polymorpha]